MSTSSHHSSESSRSLSPPVGPTRSPAQSRAQLVSLQEEENTPSEFQQALMNKLRMRSQSAADESDCPPPINPRSFSLGCKASPPPVLSKPSRPPAIPQKPLRTPTLAEISISGKPRQISEGQLKPRSPVGFAPWQRADFELLFILPIYMYQGTIAQALVGGWMRAWECGTKAFTLSSCFHYDNGCHGYHGCHETSVS